MKMKKSEINNSKGEDKMKIKEIVIASIIGGILAIVYNSAFALIITNIKYVFISFISGFIIVLLSCILTSSLFELKGGLK